jgi:ABC-type branched-subunit amino acid transport system ATPase component
MRHSTDAHHGPAIALSINNLHAGYGQVEILHGVSFDVKEGEIVGVLGRNGAGKTTLLKTIMGVIRATRGHVMLAAEQSLEASTTNEIAMAGVGYVPQGRAIFPALTVMENLQVAQFAHGKTAARVQEMVEMLPALKPHLRARGGGLSGGQPSEGIQPSILDEIIEILSTLIRRTSMSILLVEQNLDFAAALADKAYVMEMGKIVRSLGNAELNANQLARDLMVAV